MRMVACFALLALALSYGQALAQDAKFTLTKERLIETRWQTSHPKKPLSTCELFFRPDGTYKLHCHCQSDDVYDLGNYRIDSGRVLLERTRCKTPAEGMTCTPERSFEKIVCAVEKTPESVMATQVFRCRPSSVDPVFTFGLPGPGYGVPGGQKKVIEGVPVITVKQKGRTTDNAKIRTKPSVRAKLLTWTPMPLSAEDETPRPFVPAGTDLYILGRTRARERIGEWNHYWYYVDVRADILPLSGWMYGQLIQIRP